MIEATIATGVEGGGLGRYRFEALPSPGDRIVVGSVSGSCDVLIVDFVEHHPVIVPTPRNARPDPHVMIFVHYYESFGY